MTRKATTNENAPTTFRVVDGEPRHGSRCQRRTIYINQTVLRTIESEIADTCREGAYDAENQRAHYAELRERGVTHIMGWSTNEIELVFTQYSGGDAERAPEWCECDVRMPTGISSMRACVAMFELISKKLVKVHGEEWRDPDLLCKVLRDMGAVQVYRVNPGKGCAEIAALARGRRELDPIYEPVIESAAE